jgi:DMSO/TMAO reductase YedYZ molybdopterin-dependent catalytic subunit
LQKKNSYRFTFAIALGLLLCGLATPVFADSQWIIQISGAVANPISLTLDDLAAMPQTTVNAALVCYNIYVASGSWTGVKLSYLLEQAGVQQGARSVIFFAQDGYSSGISIETAQREDVIVALTIEGQPLVETLRLVVPGFNGEFWVAMITSIEVSMDLYTPPQHDTLPAPQQNQTSTAPSPPTSPKNQTGIQSATPSTDSQPLQQTEVPSSSNVPAEYGYPIILAAVASTTTAIGYVAYDHRKNTNKKANSDSHQTQA